jgi:hypothetical protein
MIDAITGWQNWLEHMAEPADWPPCWICRERQSTVQCALCEACVCEEHADTSDPEFIVCEDCQHE